jgi:hypothetical protein
MGYWMRDTGYGIWDAKKPESGGWIGDARYWMLDDMQKINCPERAKYNSQGQHPWNTVYP